MLTIQPNFSQQRLQSRPAFGFREDFEDDDYMSGIAVDDFEDDSFSKEEPDEITTKANDLKDLKDGINETMANIKDLENEVPLPNWMKSGISGLFTLGAAVVTGISMKFGFGKTSEYLGKLAKSNSIKKASGNIKGSFAKLGEAIGKCVDVVKNTKVYKAIAGKISKAVDSFNNTKFGKKISEFTKKISNSKIAKKVKAFFGKTKNIDSKKVVDRTGDVLGAATGVSTAAVGIVDPEQKAKMEG